MKGIFAKQGFRTLVAMFFVAFAMLVTAGRASAQNLSGGTNVVVDKQATFKANSDAIDALKLDLANNWVPQLDINPNNSNALRHALYYKAIMQELLNGESVGLALIKSLPAAGRLGTEDEIPGTSQSVLQSLYEDAKQVVKL